MSKHHLGEFEEVVLLTVAVLYGEAYGVPIIDEMEKRLEKKGYLTSEFGEATQVRGGKRKRFFTVTNFGQQALEEAKNQRLALWNAIPKIAFNPHS